ncbi:L-2-amino-thiazoline-4-carboxylic acid hydrolase [Roseburia sp. MSJ-14]|nr:L-2-amino-thiazoline-4-carboxylic acid hydrolase [Roseburia sp. MSJ-14]
MLKYGIYAKAVELLCFKPAFVFSLHKAEPDKINPDIVNEMVTAVFDSPFMIKAHKNKKCTLFTDKVQDKKVKESIASQTSKFEPDWKFHYEKGIDEFYNTYTECSISKLGKRENCFEFVPCLCNMDERNYRNDGGQLHRTKTLAQGDDCCNFHVTKIKMER